MMVQYLRKIGPIVAVIRYKILGNLFLAPLFLSLLYHPFYVALALCHKLGFPVSLTHFSSIGERVAYRSSWTSKGVVRRCALRRHFSLFSSASHNTFSTWPELVCYEVMGFLLYLSFSSLTSLAHHIHSNHSLTSILLNTWLKHVIITSYMIV